MSPIRRGSRLAGATVLVLTLLATGCSISTDEEPSDASSSPSAETSPAETETSSTATPTLDPTPTEATATPTTPAPSPTVAPPTASGPEAALLAATELPGLNDTYTWREQRTGPAGTAPFGICQKFDLNSIGAMDTRERVFTGDGGSAGQQIADFADPQTALRATKVLQSWHQDCRSRVRGRNVVVRPIENVAVGSGSAWHYLVSYRRGGQGHFESFGAAVSGTRMALLRIAHTGDDHNYEPGQDPMELAVQAAAVKFAR